MLPKFIKQLRKLVSYKSHTRSDEIASPGSTPDLSLSEQKPLSILLLENKHSDATRAVSVLNRAGFKVSAHVVSSENAFRRQIASRTFDVVLADYWAGAWNVLEALKVLQQIKSDIPLILVTRMSRNDIIAECLKRGAADYVRKEDLNFLPIAVRDAIRERRPNFFNTSGLI